MTTRYVFSVAPNVQYGIELSKLLNGLEADRDIVNKIFKNITMTDNDMALKRVMDSFISTANSDIYSNQNMLFYKSSSPGTAVNRDTQDYAKQVCIFLRNSGLEGCTYLDISKNSSYVDIWGGYPNLAPRPWANRDLKQRIDEMIETNKKLEVIPFKENSSLYDAGQYAYITAAPQVNKGLLKSAETSTKYNDVFFDVDYSDTGFSEDDCEFIANTCADQVLRSGFHDSKVTKTGSKTYRYTI